LSEDRGHGTGIDTVFCATQGFQVKGLFLHGVLVGGTRGVKVGGIDLGVGLLVGVAVFVGTLVGDAVNFGVAV
jgi:hypothetical protein